jgi:membrane protein
LDKRQLYSIFKSSFKDFLEDDAVLRAAALTFFIILPLPTLLLLAVGLFSLFFGQAGATQIIVQQISAVAGPAVAELFNQVITNTGSPFTSAWTTIVVVGFSIGGAIGAFSVLRDTMDCIWEVTLPKGRPLLQRIRQRIVPFAVVSALGLIVIAWTAVATGIFNAIMQYSVNSAVAAVGIAISQVITSFIVATVLLAIIYKMIPESHVHWQDVAIASIVTGIAFTITNYIFGWYIANFSPTTVAGAAGSLLIILLWIFVLNQIVLFGAEISKVYAVTVGRHAKLHLPKPVEEAAKPIEEAGKKIEQATKEDVVRTGEPTVKSEGKEASAEHVPEKSEESRKEEKST